MRALFCYGGREGKGMLMPGEMNLRKRWRKPLPWIIPLIIPQNWVYLTTFGELSQRNIGIIPQNDGYLPTFGELS